MPVSFARLTRGANVVLVCFAVLTLLAVYVYTGKKSSQSTNVSTSLSHSPRVARYPSKWGKIREFPRKELFYSKEHTFGGRVFPAPCSKRRCRKWAVTLATTQKPSEAVRKFLYMEDWCLVVIGTHHTYTIDTTFQIGDHKDPGCARMVFLPPSELGKMRSQFVDALPRKHLGLKNAGYLYAVANGAEVIWDFDEDCQLKFWIRGAVEEESQMSLDDIAEMADQGPRHASLVKESSTVAFNPYQALGLFNLKDVWPRGFPLNAITNEPPVHDIAPGTTTGIGVLQSFVDNVPDVNLKSLESGKVPNVFQKPKVPDSILALDHGVFSPYSSLATLHFKTSFFALYLPVTVPSRISDIWRGYIAQALFHISGLKLGFLPRPIVFRDQTKLPSDQHLLKDDQLTEKTGSLLKFLKFWTKEMGGSKEDNLSFEEKLGNLWISLYERKYIEMNDVLNIQLWLQVLGGVRDDLQPLNAFNSAKIHMIHLEYLGNFSVGQRIATFPDLSKGAVQDCRSVTAGPKRQFLTGDLHDGSRIDLASALSHLGQEVVLTGPKQNKGPYPALFKLPGVLNYKHMSPTLSHYNSHSTPLRVGDAIQNFNFYNKFVPEIRHVDAFYCSFPASMCQIWTLFNRSMVFMPSHRYNLGRCTPKEWNDLTSQLFEWSKDPRHTIGARSRYDYEYLRYYTGLINIQWLPSYSGFFMRNEYKPTRPEMLVVHVDGKLPSAQQQVFDRIDKKFKATYFYKLYPRVKHSKDKPGYTLDQLVSHPAIILFPYSVMSFKLAEFYALSLPIFVPSLKFFRLNGGLGSDRSSTSLPYCHEVPDLNRHVAKSARIGHPYSPNTEFSEDAEAELYWLQLSDFYDWPHIQQFDDEHDLNEKLQTTNLTMIHEKMLLENQIRANVVEKNWCNILSRIPKSNG